MIHLRPIVERILLAAILFIFVHRALLTALASYYWRLSKLLLAASLYHRNNLLDRVYECNWSRGRSIG